MIPGQLALQALWNSARTVSYIQGLFGGRFGGCTITVQQARKVADVRAGTVACSPFGFPAGVVGGDRK